MSDYFESGFFVKEPAWHRLGTVLESAPSVDEAYALSGLNWEVIKKPLYILENNGLKIKIKNNIALTRSDNNEVLGVKTNQYYPLQNHKLFEFVAPYINESSLKFESAGSLRKGKDVWILCDVDDNIREVKGDSIKQYFLISNNHEGNKSIKIVWTTVRVVCANTLDIALRQGTKVTIKHDSKMETNLELMRAEIDFAKQTFTKQISVYNELVEKEVTVSSAREMLEKLFEKDLVSKEGENISVNELRATKLILNNFQSTPDLQTPEVRGTGWAFYNAVTQYYSYQRKGTDDSRLGNLWGGKVQSEYDATKKIILSV